MGRVPATWGGDAEGEGGLAGLGGGGLGEGGPWASERALEEGVQEASRESQEGGVI